MSSPSPRDPADNDRRHEEWVRADRAHVWHPYTQMRTAPPPVPIVRAEGVYLYTADGRRILDGVSSWWVNIHGHSHPRLNRALAEQAARLEQVIFAGFTHEPAARLAADLVARLPRGLTRVFYSDDGSTAVEVALKIAYQHWRNRGERGRTRFVALDGAYHGDTFGAMAASGPSAFQAPFRDLLFEVRRARCPGCAPAGETDGTLEEILAREGERVAAVIVEPMLQGAGGMRTWPAAALRDVRALTRSRGIPLIADEILTGFGRTGKLFACEHGPISPDIVCLAKGLTGGYLPLSATVVTEELYASFLGEEREKALLHGHSFTANPLACAVAMESLALFDDEDRLARVAAIEQRFAERVRELREHPLVETTRVLGGVAALELRPGGSGGYLDRLGPFLYDEFLRRDVLLRPLGNVVYFLPPYVIADDEIDRVFDVIGEVLDAGQEYLGTLSVAAGS